jgi:hypothetical protein
LSSCFSLPHASMRMVRSAAHVFSSFQHLSYSLLLKYVWSFSSRFIGFFFFLLFKPNPLVVFPYILHINISSSLISSVLCINWLLEFFPMLPPPYFLFGCIGVLCFVVLNVRNAMAGYVLGQRDARDSALRQ